MKNVFFFCNLIVLHTEARSHDRKEKKRATSDLTLKAGLKDHKDHGEFEDPVRQERCGITSTNFCATLCEVSKAFALYSLVRCVPGDVYHLNNNSP